MNIGDHQDPLRNKLLATHTPDLFPIIPVIITDYTVNGGKGFAFTEKAGIGDKLTGLAEIELPVRQIPKQIYAAILHQGEGMKERAAHRGTHDQDKAEDDQDDDPQITSSPL